MENLSSRNLKSYEIQEVIGEGGFGVVYRAVQASIGREVAVKIILPRHANQPEFVRRFEVEAQLVARLEHPHIVPLYDYWRDPEGAFLVMRYLKGGSLRDSLAEHGAWNPAQVAQMLQQIGAALAFAHVNGVIHRDLKTDNILLDETGNCYLTDFGIAKDLEIQENHTKDAILGTPAYLSPEQIRGNTASIRSDIYSLGIMIFEALTSSKPFYDATPATVLFKQLNEPLPSIRDYREDLPIEVDIVLQRATSKDATLRYESVLEFVRDFTNVVEAASGEANLSGNVTLDIASITEQESELFQAKNPYKGLRAFQTVDANDFFGRDDLIETLVNHLSITGKRNDFLAVVGPSGSGKSSVVKAGLTPRIQNNILDQEIEWYTAEMVPGTHPMEEMEAALLAVATDKMPDLYDLLRTDERGLVRAIKRILPENAEFVLFIDQFEETFTLIPDESERVHFLNSILNAVEDERSRIKIIITLRADFYDRPLLYSDFGKLIRANTELVLPLDESELVEAISGPARRVNVELEAGLVTAIVKEVASQPGALPLLQYALTELFERRRGRMMTLEAYQEIGGTTGALARRADELFESFTDAEKDATRQMFLRLVTLGEGTDDTRRRVFQSELLSLSRNKAAMPTVISQFGKYRLLTFDHDPQTRSSTIEVAHEALIRQWDRVREWLDENREALRLQRRLTSAAQEWQQARRDQSFLARGMRLQQFEGLVDADYIVLNETERIFVDMSVDAREERARAEEERERLEEEREEKERVRLRNFAIAMGVTAIIAVGAAIFAVLAQMDAQEQTELAVIAQQEALDNEAESRSLALAANARNADNNGDPQLALILALASDDQIDDVPSEILRTMANLIYAPGPEERYTIHEGSVTGVAFSADSTLIASSSVDGTIRVVDAETDEVQITESIDDGWFYDVAIHPENTQFAGAASDGTVYVWAYPSGDLLYQLSDHTDEVMSVDYSADGNLLASGSADSDIILWDTATGEQLLLLAGHDGVVLNVVFSPDSTRLASSSADETLGGTNEDVEDRTVRIWDTETGEQVTLIEPNNGFVRALDYSPNGDTVAYGVWSSATSGIVFVHDAESGEEVRRFIAHTTPITSVAYNADGTQLASIAWDRNLRIWDLNTGTEVQTFVGFDDRVLSMDYSDDGQGLAIGVGNIGDNIYSGNDSSADSSIWLWDINNREQVFAYTESPDWFWTVDISADGTMGATSGGPLNFPTDFASNQEVQSATLTATSVRVFDMATGDTIAVLPAHQNTVDSVTFHPNSEQLLSSSWDSDIILWDIANESEIRRYDNGHDSEVYMVRFLNNGDNFVSVGQDGKAILWDTNTGEQIQVYEHDVRVSGVNFNADETLMALAGGDWGAPEHPIFIWNLETNTLEQTIVGHSHIVNEVIFHPTEPFIVSSSWDGTLRVWDATTGTQVRAFSGHNGQTFGLDFSEDGEILLSTSQDTTVRMWDWATGEELQRFSLHNDWIQEVVFGPDDTIALSAGQDPAVRVWRINRTAEALEDFAEENRYLRPFSCTELSVYRLGECETDQ